MDPEGSGGRTASEALAGLRVTEPPRLVFLRRAPAGLGDGAGVLLCLSASFNPLTVAHTALIREASRLMPPREILLLLAMANVDKPVTGLPLEARLDLLVRYAESRPSLSVAAVAHGRFVDKLEAIRAAYPAETRVIFLLGFDTLVRLFDPKYYPDRTAALSRLFGGSECVVANRSPAPPSDVDAFLARDEVFPFVRRIHSIQLPADLAEVSATAVRARLALGEPVFDLIPPEIRTALSRMIRERSDEPPT